MSCFTCPFARLTLFRSVRLRFFKILSNLPGKPVAGLACQLECGGAQRGAPVGAGTLLARAGEPPAPLPTVGS